jgi:hypothetical protein
MLFDGTPKTEEVIDIGETVICDKCNGDWSERTESGGFLFLSSAYCPDCEKDALKSIESYGEQKHIKGYCPEGVSFKDWVLTLRGGDNTIKIQTWD